MGTGGETGDHTWLLSMGCGFESCPVLFCSRSCGRLRPPTRADPLGGSSKVERLVLVQDVGGSNPPSRTVAVAQLVGRLTVNEVCAGSSPVGHTRPLQGGTNALSGRTPLSSSGKDLGFSARRHGFDSRQGYCGVEERTTRRSVETGDVGSSPTSTTRPIVGRRPCHLKVRIPVFQAGHTGSSPVGGTHDTLRSCAMVIMTRRKPTAPRFT